MPDIFLYGGQANPNDVKLTDPTQLAGGAGEVTSTATWDQAPASWEATGSETVTGTGTYVQAAATWAADVSETVTGTGSFTQAAASWSATGAETLTSTATWAQTPATWSADATHTPAGASFTATWTQAPATWAAVSEQLVPFVPVSGGRRIYRKVLPTEIRAYAAFAQSPATWRAFVTVDDDDVVMGLSEDSLLDLVLV